MLLLLHILALAAYLVAAVALVTALAGRRTASALPVWAASAGVALHAGGLMAYWLRWGEPPLAGLGPVLSSIGLLVALASVVVSLVWRIGPIGLVLSPLAAVLTGLALGVGMAPAAPVPAGVAFLSHVVLAVLAYVAVAVAFAAGAMYLLQFRQLRGKRFGAIFRFFPPLETLDRVGRAATAVGFVCISLALLIGWSLTLTAYGTLAPGNPQVIWGVLTWLVLLGILLARRSGGRREQRAAAASVVGFGVIVLAFIVLRVAVTRGGGFL
jgi:HemX protein